MLGFLVSVSSAAAQGNGNGNGNDPSRSPPPDYFPYPPGVIPNDIVPETERVRREIRGIEQKTLAEAAALGPLMPTSPSQELAGNGQPGLWLRRVPTLAVEIPPTLREYLGQAIIRYQIPTRHREDLRHPRRRVRQRSHAAEAIADRSGHCQRYVRCLCAFPHGV